MIRTSKMVQIAGKYELVENKNFYEFMVKMGIPEEHALKANEAKSIMEVEVDGNKVRLISDAQRQNLVAELILNEEVDERMPLGNIVKSTATLDDNVLTIKSKESDGKIGTRIYTFSDTGVEMV
ncbi:hypothetical protein NQ314_006760 [Rhamnusium bicolor]|uniref:Uncharacterized protein n=1 Tax=Rhamnusium bicolor TaxID=1586634 RepID=A0AAV8YWM6_9CUCU|nr:hypothetical protein NQ314_006760 [Rhamnusium bicolor]